MSSKEMREDVKLNRIITNILLVFVFVSFALGVGLLMADIANSEDYVKPALNEVNCDNVEYHYEMCEIDGAGMVWQVSSCRERYTPKIMQCFARDNSQALKNQPQNPSKFREQ